MSFFRILIYIYSHRGGARLSNDKSAFEHPPAQHLENIPLRLFFISLSLVPARVCVCVLLLFIYTNRPLTFHRARARARYTRGTLALVHIIVLARRSREARLYYYIICMYMYIYIRGKTSEAILTKNAACFILLVLLTRIYIL